ncbi:MAG: hypothetical protein OEZ20_05690 [candidate division WOR-3 bacterium]|nr:hypothetical protein [candidate division WOR-3 bacterium]MDH5683938.1 hypothetical protein [candidate division WOR-3 bacterium]
MNKLILIFALFVLLAYGHQPRLVYDEELTIENPKIVENPEISQAFYGKLKGKPEYYKIGSDQEFNLYVNIVVPAKQGARTDFRVEISIKDTFITLNGESFQWEKFFEQFGGDHYLKGPEFEKRVRKGEYLIKVYNPANQGSYSLVVGKIEAFPPKEAINAILSLPKLKKDFFAKSPFTAFFNYIGLFLLVTLVILAGVILLLVFIIRRITKHKPQKA